VAFMGIEAINFISQMTNIPIVRSYHGMFPPVRKQNEAHGPSCSGRDRLSLVRSGCMLAWVRSGRCCQEMGYMKVLMIPFLYSD
jgi:hypothetical protein